MGRLGEPRVGGFQGAAGPWYSWTHGCCDGLNRTNARSTQSKLQDEKGAHQASPLAEELVMSFSGLWPPVSGSAPMCVWPALLGFGEV